MLRRLALLCLTALGIAGCAGTAPLGNPEVPYTPPRPPVIGDYLHLPTGSYLSRPRMLELTRGIRVLYVGETHDNPASHRLQLELLERMHRDSPGAVALGMEMFNRAQQQALDRWVAGELTEKQFLKQAAWHRNWRMDYRLYRPLLDFARENRIPVIALNAAREQVVALRANDPDDLSEELRLSLPELDMEDPYQKAMTEAVFGGHAKGKSIPEGFHRIQTLWDETMGQSVARYLGGPTGEHMRMLVVAGGNHIRYGFGIPRRAFKRLPHSYLLVGGQELEIGADKADRLMDIEVPEFPMRPWDILAYLPYEDLEPKAVSLGVMLEEAHGEVFASAVLPGSTAEKAGLMAEDRLLAIDGESVTEAFDLIYAVSRKAPGDEIRLRVRRGEQELKLSAAF